MKLIRTIWYVNVGRVAVSKAKATVAEFKKSVEQQQADISPYAPYLIRENIFVPVTVGETYCTSETFDFTPNLPGV